VELLANPIEQLRSWYADAEAVSPNADVVALATSDLQ